MLEEPTGDGVAGLVICNGLLLLWREDFAALLEPGHDALDSGLKVRLGDAVGSLTPGNERT